MFRTNGLFYSGDSVKNIVLRWKIVYEPDRFKLGRDRPRRWYDTTIVMSYLELWRVDRLESV